MPLLIQVVLKSERLDKNFLKWEFLNFYPKCNKLSQNQFLFPTNPYSLSLAMAFHVRKATKIITPHFRNRINFLGFLEMGFLSSYSTTHFRKTPFSGRKIGDGVLGFEDMPAHLCTRRFESNKVEKQLDSVDDDRDNQVLDFPGGKVRFTPQMSFIPDRDKERVPCFRVLDDNGQPSSKYSNCTQVSKEVAMKIYNDMVTLRTMDTIFYEAQRQGRISFYVTSIGEEAINIASAAALSLDDLIVPQYREAGVLIWRGFTLKEFANQCFGNKHDYCKGRQMPVHYGSKRHNYFTVASTIASQIPHAVGAAYSMKMEKRDACAVTYFGDGGTSEGDFHAALNFAAVLEVPVIFICRNNGWAISTPIWDQFRSDGVVVKGQAYGVCSIRVDGNDALAVYTAVRAARKMAVQEQRPILIEALTYRVGHHTTSDDSTRYRSAEEIEWWRVAKDPVSRFRKWIESNGWWSNEAEAKLKSDLRKQLLEEIQLAEKSEMPPVADALTDVYDVPPSNLQEQEKWLRKTIKSHPQDYPSNFPL